ncbi:MAG: hypothetical protein IT168_31020 [Bryobacterales bacterium]|nr:hypothetical protein [Bryobacterales bacterium]
MARKTLDQVITAQQRAINLMLNVGDEDRAQEFASMDPEEYAERKGIEITEPNPTKGALTMARQQKPTRAELEQENAELKQRLESIMGVAAGDVEIVEEEEEDDVDLDDEDEYEDEEDDEEDDEE